MFDKSLVETHSHKEDTMKTIQLSKWTIIVLPIFCVALFGLAVATAADQQSPKVVPEFGTPVEPGIAAGAEEDTLQACIARIPNDASIGQLMMAQQGCWRDENDRKPLLAVPEARSIRFQQP